MDKGLEEQLERMRLMAARIAEMQERLAETRQMLTRERDVVGGSPLNNVRDVRPWSAPEHYREAGSMASNDESSASRHRTAARARRRRR